MAARKKSSSTEAPIPLLAITQLEAELGRSLDGWEAKEPLHRSPSPERLIPGAWFDVAAVVHVVKALRRMPHTKGEWYRTPFEPETWQIVWLIAPVFGWKHPEGPRIVREVWDEVPRKNGKSSIASRLALVLAAADGEYGGEVYAAATSTDQAKAVFNEARVVAERSVDLKRRTEILASVIRFPRTGSIFRVLSRMADAAHGLNVSGGVVDEIHLHKSRDLIDAIETGTGARRQPLIIYITTAGGADDTTIYAEKHGDAADIASGKVTDPSVWVCIWAATEHDDPHAEATWEKANPNYPISPSREYLQKKSEKAQRRPSFLATYLRLHLNVRSGGGVNAWTGAEAWENKGNAGMVPLDKLAGAKCWGGMIAASATDLAALCWTFRNPEGLGVWALWRYFLPEDRLEELARRTNGAAADWSRKGGPLTLTEGDQLDISAVVAQILADTQTFDVRELAYDPGGSLGIVQPLMADNVVPLVPIYASTPGTALIDWEQMLRAGRYNHGGNPITAWQVASMGVRETGAGVWRIERKAAVVVKPYGPVAAELSLRRYLVAQEAKPRKPATLVTFGG